MKFVEVFPLIAEVPHSNRAQCRALFDFVRSEKPERVLELGCAHGKSACAIAAALDENGRGRLTTIDRPHVRNMKPSVFDLLRLCELQRWVEVVLTPSSYNWELMKMIERNTTGDRCEPVFDFCFVDGAHSWETDGLAFFLLDKLLRPGGWILFDDIDWSYDRSPTMRHTERVKSMPEDERTTPQVERVVRLLVEQHPAYSEIRREEKWAWARKKPLGNGGDV